MNLKLIGVIIGAALVAGCASAPNAPALSKGDEQTEMTYLKALIQHEMDEGHIAGLSVAIVDDQRVVWSSGFGWADKGAQIQATEHTQYRVGSLSKLFTDVAAMQLVEGGQLNLDQPVSTYLPDFRVLQPDGSVSAITPRLLMTHHAGLPRDIIKGFMTVNARPEPFCSVVAQLNATGSDDAPGRMFSYSNAGLSVLGCTVQRLSKSPFETRMRDAVLGPMGMQESLFEAGPGIRTGMAKGYMRGEEANEPALRDIPAGGLTSSVHDMSHFMSMLFASGQYKGHAILSAASVREMWTPQNADVALDAGFHVGLGWMLSTLGRSTIKNAGPVAHHAGATRLFHSQIYVLPQHKIGVVVLSNDATAKQAVDRIANRALAAHLQVKTGIKQPPFEAIPWATHRELNAATAREWAGHYVTMVGPVQVMPRKEGMQVQVMGKRLDMRLRTDARWSLDYALLGLIHIPLGQLSDMGLSRRNIDGIEVLVSRVGDQDMVIGSKVAPRAITQAISPAWGRRLGHYRITNLGDDFLPIDQLQLIEEDGRLMMQFTDKMGDGDSTQRILLSVESDTEARALQILPDAGPRLRVIRVDGAEQLQFGGYLAALVRS